MGSLELPGGVSGQAIYRFDLWATVVFVVAASLAAAIGALRVPFAVLCCGLFALGVVAFLVAYGRALRRSRDEEIALSGIYGLAGSCPSAVAWRFHLLTLAQTAAAITTASMRPFTAQAFGILVPMLGLGLGGLWAATHGRFGPRDDPRNRAVPGTPRPEPYESPESDE